MCLSAVVRGVLLGSLCILGSGQKGETGKDQRGGIEE